MWPLSAMDALILEHFRCFRSFQEVPLSPLTFLVGENSTGKSTFLAAARLATNFSRFGVQVDFNEPPFTLGAYDQIASYAGGKGGRAKTFKLGYEQKESTPNTNVATVGFPLRLIVTFSPVVGQPRISEICIQCGDEKMSILPASEADSIVLEIETADQKHSATVKFPTPLGVTGNFSLFFFLISHLESIRDRDGNPTKIPPEAIAKLRTLVNRGAAFQISRCFASAPIRMKPERTYDPETDTPRPEGNHIPMVMAQMALNNPEKWKQIKAALTRFGEATGLFVDVAVRRLGTQISNPFQLRFKVSGPPDNLVDVGYGISQVLPILVEVLISEESQFFLLQQPEVHLHPRAQAELGTFLAEIAAKGKHQFLVETHSDFMIDRVCIDIRDRKTGLRPQDVTILYFERKGRWVKVHPITIDDAGNIQGAPKGYRSFFLKEDARFFER